MSDNQRRRGGAFTFLLAFAAFIMSSIALLQNNVTPEQFEKLKTDLGHQVTKLKTASAEWMQKGGDAIAESVTLDSIIDQLRAARDLALEGGGLEKAGDLLKTVGERIDDYIKYLRSEGDDIDPQLEKNLRDLQSSIAEAKSASRSKTADSGEAAAKKLDELIAAAEKLKADG